MDIKDTNGGVKVKKMRQVLNKLLYAFYDDVVKNIQLDTKKQMRTHEELLTSMEFLQEFLCYQIST